jgi:hypothetical protein
MGKKPASSGAKDMKDDRKTNVTLVLEPEKYTKINIFILTLLVVLLLGTQFIENSSSTEYQKE